MLRSISCCFCNFRLAFHLVFSALLGFPVRVCMKNPFRTFSDAPTGKLSPKERPALRSRLMCEDTCGGKACDAGVAKGWTLVPIFFATLNRAKLILKHRAGNVWSQLHTTGQEAVAMALCCFPLSISAQVSRG